MRTPPPNPYIQESPANQIRHAEREAKSRIEQLEKQTKEAESELERDLNTKRDHFERRRSEESLDQEQSIENQKSKGYAEIRRIQRAQQEEINQLRREGETEISRLQNYYKNTLDKTYQSGEKDLDNTRARYGRALEYETQSTKGQFEFEKNENALRLQQLKEEQDDRTNAFQKAGIEHYSKVKANTQEAMDQTEEHFKNNYAHTLKQQQDVLSDLQNRASEALHTLRDDTSTKLAAYASRQKDPFYQLVRLDSDLDETDEAYLLSIRVPEHEQDHIKVTVRGNEIVVSGQRKNEEKLNPSTGGSLRTASYQSFSESFPISQPVEGKLLTRHYDGSELTIQIPKKIAGLTHQSRETRESKRPKRALATTRPDFPENIPTGAFNPKGAKNLKGTLL